MNYNPCTTSADFSRESPISSVLESCVTGPVTGAFDLWRSRLFIHDRAREMRVLLEGGVLLGGGGGRMALWASRGRGYLGFSPLTLQTPPTSIRFEPVITPSKTERTTYWTIKVDPTHTRLNGDVYLYVYHNSRLSNKSKSICLNIITIISCIIHFVWKINSYICVMEMRVLSRERHFCRIIDICLINLIYTMIKCVTRHISILSPQSYNLKNKTRNSSKKLFNPLIFWTSF